ncbi:MAG: hypothetical protein ACK4FB_13945, partial [Brevundimonas sp.]|uniref:hypothetical protein n=1 Tax=Brevundimonas sp. TaxID=1871086 RepID=UPI0039188129
ASACNAAPGHPAAAAPGDPLSDKGLNRRTALRGSGEEAPVARPLHCFSHPESDNAGPDP